MSRDGGVALPHGATGLSAVCDCGILSLCTVSTTKHVSLSPFGNSRLAPLNRFKPSSKIFY